MKLKDTLPLIFASIIGGIANIGDLFANFILPISKNFTNNEISASVLLLILFSACLLFLYTSLENSPRSTPVKLKLIKYIMITSFSFSLIFSVGLVVPNMITSTSSASSSKLQKQINPDNKDIERLKLEIELVREKKEHEKEKNKGIQMRNKQSKNTEKN